MIQLTHWVGYTLVGGGVFHSRSRSRASKRSLLTNYDHLLSPGAAPDWFRNRGARVSWDLAPQDLFARTYDLFTLYRHDSVGAGTRIAMCEDLIAEVRHRIFTEEVYSLWAGLELIHMGRGNIPFSGICRAAWWATRSLDRPDWGERIAQLHTDVMRHPITYPVEDLLFLISLLQRGYASRMGDIMELDIPRVDPWWGDSSSHCML